MSKTREQHLADCKRAALEYLDTGDVTNAIASMMSDMRKHDETRVLNEFIVDMGLAIVVRGDPHEARRWIEGFH
jgi:hypothetical protein